jgi:hypothetical protein
MSGHPHRELNHAPSACQVIELQPAASAKGSRLKGLAQRLSAPVFGSRLFFPRRLARAMASGSPLLTGSIPRHHARAYFGDELTVWVDPAGLAMRLRNNVTDGRNPFLLSDRFIDGADWSRIVAPEADLPEHREMFQLAVYRDRFPEMPAFADLLASARRQRPQRRNHRELASDEDVFAYFRHYLALVESIERDGFQDRRALGRYRLPGTSGRFQPHAHRRNIGVAIASNGEVYRFLGGRHRLAIAQGLNVPEIPVDVRLLHADWLRAEMRRTGLSAVLALRNWVESRSRPAAIASPNAAVG